MSQYFHWPPHWTDQDMKAKFDVNHHPSKAQEAASSEKPPLRGVRRIASWTYKGIMFTIFFAFLFGLIRGIARI